MLKIHVLTKIFLNENFYHLLEDGGHEGTNLLFWKSVKLKEWILHYFHYLFFINYTWE